MRFVMPSVMVENVSGDICMIERAGRVCYKSEDRIAPDTAEKFVKMLIKRGREAVLEHASVTMKIVCDRGISHEIVRHRLASYSQESTRYVNYRDKCIAFVLPHWMLKHSGSSLAECEAEFCAMDFAERYGTTSPEFMYLQSLYNAEQTYKKLMLVGWAPQDARAVLPNALKTEIVMTANLREWRHFLKMRNAPEAHPDMQVIAKMVLFNLTSRPEVSAVFEDMQK